MTMNDESHCDSSNQTAFSGGANKVKHRWLFSFSFRLFRARRFKKKNKNKQKTNKKQKKPQQQHSTVEWGLAEFGWQRKTKWPTTKRKKRLFFPEKLGTTTGYISINDTTLHDPRSKQLVPSMLSR